MTQDNRGRNSTAIDGLVAGSWAPTPAIRYCSAYVRRTSADPWQRIETTMAADALPLSRFGGYADADFIRWLLAKLGWPEAHIRAPFIGYQYMTEFNEPLRLLPANYVKVMRGEHATWTMQPISDEPYMSNRSWTTLVLDDDGLREVVR